jgi:hypothetical protein
MRRFFAALLGVLIGYPLFAVAGYWAIGLFSHNHVDGSVEASMTAAFVFGPAGALIGPIAGPSSASGSQPLELPREASASLESPRTSSRFHAKAG